VLRTDDLAPLHEWVAREEPVWSLASSPDGRWIASASEDDTAAVWDAETGALVARLPWSRGYLEFVDDDP